MTIELRLTDVDPPTAEPARTIYRDIANLPDPSILGVTIRYFNYDDAGLYMQITGSATGYTFTPVNLGLLATGANAYQNLDNFASRAKPTVAQLPNGEMSENITLTLKGYTDSGYTDLKWTFERVVTVIWLNSADAAFTVDELDNFDDGTVQGWEATAELNCTVSLGVVTDYVLSTPYSLKVRITGTLVTGGETRARISKSFDTPDKSEVYAIIDMRLHKASTYPKYLRVQIDETILIFLGRPYDATSGIYVPLDKWMRVVVPLPANSTVDMRLIEDGIQASASGFYVDFWIDDFKIISK